jgi:hypothetical protein
MTGAAAPPSAACQRGRWSPWAGLALRSNWCPPQLVPPIVLVGRATSVPFTRATTGPERITTDKTTAAMACDSRRRPR